MKMRNTLLVAMGAILSVFGAGRLQAESLDDDYLRDSVRIEKITKVTADGTDEFPLQSASTIYFDVTLKDNSGAANPLAFYGNTYAKELDNAKTDRPYLVLNIPLRGVSSRGTDLVTGEVETETNTAVAYYIGEGSAKNVLRFAYTVRPGDMSDGITWVRTGGDANPRFGGDVGLIKVSMRRPGMATTTTGVVQGNTLTKATGADLDSEDTANPMSVSGYTFTVGAAYEGGKLVAPGTNKNKNKLYQGLVPVTISTRENAAATTFTSTSLAGDCAFWVEAYDDASASWKFAPAGVTALEAANTVIAEGTYTADVSDTYNADFATEVNGPDDPTATTFAAQTYFVNIPASIPADRKMRLCYGVKPTNGSTQTLFASYTLNLRETPLASHPDSSGYMVVSTQLDEGVDGTLTLPATGLSDAALHGTTVKGGTINAAASETVDLLIAKNNMADLNAGGTLFASIARVSTTNGANAQFERYYVPLDPADVDGYVVKLTIPRTAGNGTSYFRIRIPQLDADGSVDAPYYLKVVSSPKRETIQLTASADTGSLGTEYYTPADTTNTDGSAVNFLKYTLTVASSTSARKFKIFPVGRDTKTEIPEGSTFADGRDVHAVISKYVKLQTQGASVLEGAGASLIVDVPAGATSADFYVACVNDYPLAYLSDTATLPDGSTTPLSGALFIAKSCNSSGVITGTNDICQGVVQPVVQNRAPMITNSNPPTSGATGSALNFTFQVVDTFTDYLVIQMNYGDGEVETFLYADDDTMTGIMGARAWENKLAEIARLYGGVTADYEMGGARRRVRSALGTELITFTHTYQVDSPSWFFTVTDSSMGQDSRQGQLSLQSSQLFTFYTIKNATVPASGYIRWGNQTSTPDDPAFGWTFGETYTYNSLTKSGGTSVTVQAMPFSAGSATPANYTPISDTKDSFFYKWGARHTDFEPLLPTDESLYERILILNRAFVSGGGEASTDATKWQDITLEAVFEAEYLPGDAYTSFAMSRTEPYLYALGDYNQDGVPDGWLLRTLGTEEGRAAVESSTSQANVAAEGDKLPKAGWGLGDVAYRLGSSNGRLATEKPCELSGANFGYKMRVRGRDDELNAADGKGNWLSNPAWVVLAHPEKEEGVVTAGTLEDGVFVPAWNQIRLCTSGVAAEAGKRVSYTANMRIPYDADDAVGGWAPVYDSEGYPIKAATGGRYVANTIMVNIDETSRDYEQFKYTYNKWYINDDLQAEGDDAIFPFKTQADTTAAMVGSVAEYSGADFDTGTNVAFHFIDARVPNGILLDEPFYVDATHLTDGALDPRKTSWLDRFNANNADQDGDGITNGAEYYFWYYASRIAWSSVYVERDANGTPIHMQVNEALWPAIDLRNRVVSDENALAANRDVDFATNELFTMGRRYRDGYDPDAPDKAYFTFDANNRLVAHPEATFGKGNYWEPISAATVLAAFNPYAVASTADPDNDGLSTAEEFAIGTNPIDCDTDDDWMLDGWEVRADLDPLNLNGTNDASLNPDNDYFARAIVKPYATFHHLFKVTVHTPAPPADPADPNAPVDPYANSPFRTSDAASYYYDHENESFYLISDNDASSPSLTLPADIGPITWAQGKDYVESWVNEEPLVVEVPGAPRIIRDFEVYKTFGFNFRTAWTASVLRATGYINSKLSAFGNAVNTVAFSNREEFNYYVKSGQYIDPKNADTNGDGCPDGWEAYVGLRPYVVTGTQDGAIDWDLDGLSAAEEFQCRASHLVGDALGYKWPDSLQSATKYDTTWVNKIFPTDPWNPDTDFDGIWDGKEGDSAYTYAPSDSTVKGGGCDPTNMDTDGDGMPDGWEYCYGKVAMTTETTTDENGETVTTTTTADVLGPDPTDPNDYDYDYDRDGLTQYQEYFTGLFRQNRYDLGPSAARIYKDVPGVLTYDEAAGTTRWKKIPNVYSATVDLLNPVEVPSADYEWVASDATGTTYETFTVNPLRQALATTSSALGRERATSTDDVESKIFMPAITDAFNRIWAASIIFPSDLQIADYGLNPEAKDEADVNGAAANEAISALRTNIDALDAAWMRLLALSPKTPNNPLFAAISGETDDAVIVSQMYALIARIDALFAKLEGLGDAVHPVIKELVANESKALWEARKAQLFKGMKDAFEVDGDTIYALMAARSAESGAAVDKRYTYRPTTTTTAAGEYSEYEEAVANATSPLHQELYRAAMRGYLGGLVCDEDSDRVYLAPLGIHMPLRTAEDRKNLGATVFLGVPLTEGTVLGAQWPRIAVGGSAPFLTTSPLVADSDMDGMDDYWEVFHGINPTLGDYVTTSSSNDSDSNYSVDRLATIYSTLVAPPRRSNANTVYAALDPSLINPFGNPIFEVGRVTGYDYYSYPWLAGVPFADPDGDGLLNFEEAVNPSASDPAHYGTDPSPLWMTDPANPNSFVTRFYTRLNANVGAGTKLVTGDDDEGMVIPAQALRGEYLPAEPVDFVGHIGDTVPVSADSSVLPYEINEGYDTDGDGISDVTELTNATIFRGDPQTLRTPDRQQAAYFGGNGVMQSHVTTQFGPMALTTFTLECWVKPDADNGDEVILIDRPWRFNEGAENPGDLRHNFRLGLKKVAGTTEFKPFANYTGAGTTFEGGTGAAPQVSPTVLCGETIKAGEWSHIAVVYDGARLSIVLNGVENAAVASSLIPANGVLSLKNDGLDDVQRFTYRRAPILIGAEPKFTADGQVGANRIPEWVPDLGDAESDVTFAQIYKNAYKGFIDEVRIWNGARTATQINEKRRVGFTQAELLTFRLNAFNERYSGGGYYENDVPAYPVAIYTFNDLLAGARDVTPEKPWERYPGEQLVGDATVPGSFLYRRTGFKQTKNDNDNPISALLPEEDEVFTSFYTLTAPKNLRSTQYCTATSDATGPQSEFVPMAHNTIDHLPVADVERSSKQNYLVQTLTNGSPLLTSPSNDAEHLKVVDSVYWSPYAAGTEVDSVETYNVKTVGNPYGYRYLGVQTFDMDSYTVLSAFTTRYTADLLIYGDVYAKYDIESWDNSPSTDPSAGKPDESTRVTEGEEWFEYKGGNDTLIDDQLSNGGQWLKDNIALGQTKDSDNDGMYNWWENYYGLDPEDPTGDNGPHGDADGDFLTNYAEFLASSNPGKYSTVGNGVPDFHIPMWFRRGRPTFGLLYTDNDFMEDHWEAQYHTGLNGASEFLDVDIHDSQKDPDNDGWSNWAEARANFRSGRHSTNPMVATSTSQTGETVLEMPTPALRLTVDFFGDQNVYTNATSEAKIVVHTYTAKGNNSAPDATFKLPLSTSAASSGDPIALTYNLGFWKRGKVSGFLHMGNVQPGSVKITYTRVKKSTQTDTQDGEIIFTIVDDVAAKNNTEGSLITTQKFGRFNSETGGITTFERQLTTGTINYTTGYFTIDFSDADFWTDEVYIEQEGEEDADKTFTFYDREEFEGVASYSYKINPGQSNTFTLVKPDSGYVKEGLNNFYVFADLNGNGNWNEGEPAGIPDQHDVDIGFDQVNRPLHVALTEEAPPGSVRFDVSALLGILSTENNTNDAITGDNSSLTNPSTGKPLSPSDFVSGLDYYLVLVDYQNLSTGEVTSNAPGIAYKKQYNVKKPYLSEDEIFGYSESGLPGTEAANQIGMVYKVYFVPETKITQTPTSWMNYNIGLVTNHFKKLNTDVTAMVSPVGGDVRHNTQLTFEWLSNVQVPTFTLSITKKETDDGQPMDKLVFEKTVRGVTAAATARGNGEVEQFTYRYSLPRGIGELNAAGDTLFGNGLYHYVLKLHSYNSTGSTDLEGDFRIQLRDSGDKALIENAAEEQSTSWNAQNSHYVRARIRYTGVLAENADFNGRRLCVEAHYSGSFNGDPIASVTDYLVYDAVDANGAYTDAGETDKINRCVRMVKDRVVTRQITDGTTTTNKPVFWGTRFDVEVRGLPSTDEVYLLAYFDLNGNGKRDAWEPWGYATQGLDSPDGYYFDPRAITPTNNGTDYQTEFYIQDVDVDNDKLADSWEWKQAGFPTGDFSAWCGTFTGTLANHKGNDIFVVDVNGNLAFTAYGAQVLGLTVIGEPDANGAVQVEGSADASVASELYNILGADQANALILAGYSSYGLSVNSIVSTGTSVTLSWDVKAARSVEDGSLVDLTAAFANTANNAANYAVYGKASLADEKWVCLGTVPVASVTNPSLVLTGDQAAITAEDGTSKPAAFFRVILSVKTAAETLE